MSITFDPILIVDDEPNIRHLLAGVLEDEGYAVVVAKDTVEARKVLEEQPVALLLLDVQLPGQDGLSFLRELQAEANVCPVIMMSGHGTIATAVEATRLGALDFVEKPILADRLLVSLGNVLRLQQLTAENSDLRSALDLTREMIGSGALMRKLRAVIAQAAPSEARVLITGENGTGKELIARALHNASARSAQPFIKVNCAAIPSELLESELFGHERGAFTGAVSRRLGKFERAQGGSLLLDEIGDMNPTTQAKLLRVLEEGELERVGGSGAIKLDVRIFASTNRDLDELRSTGGFREDLYHRLKVVPIHAPALRDHPEDLPELAEHFLRHFCTAGGRMNKKLSPAAVDLLREYSWPGNVRELRNLMERVMIMVPENLIGYEELSGLLGPVEPHMGKEEIEEEMSSKGLNEYLAHHEKNFILQTLHAVDGNVAAAGRKLGLDRANLHRRLKKLGIKD